MALTLQRRRLRAALRLIFQGQRPKPKLYASERVRGRSADLSCSTVTHDDWRDKPAFASQHIQGKSTFSPFLIQKLGNFSAKCMREIFNRHTEVIRKR